MRQRDNLTLRQARALIRHRVRKRLAKYRGQDIWHTPFFIDRLDLAAEVFDYQASRKPDGTVADISDLIDIAREEFVDFVLLEDTEKHVKFPDRQKNVACEACCQAYCPTGRARCPFCNHLNLYQLTESELSALVGQLELSDDDPIARRALAEADTLLIETSYLRIVSCFETFHKRLNKLAFGEAGSSAMRLSRPNLFQSIRDTWDWFRQYHSLDLSGGLDPDEIRLLDRVFNKRHVITHNGGIIDQRYIERTGEDPTKIEQPVDLSKREIREAIDLVRDVVQTAREAFQMPGRE